MQICSSCNRDKGNSGPGRLYFLTRMTVTGNVAASFGETSCETTKLWHMHLRHMSEKRLTH